jgi:hypothetical protein
LFFGKPPVFSAWFRIWHDFSPKRERSQKRNAPGNRHTFSLIELPHCLNKRRLEQKTLKNRDLGKTKDFKNSSIADRSCKQPAERCGLPIL